MRPKSGGRLFLSKPTSDHDDPSMPHIYESMQYGLAGVQVEIIVRPAAQVSCPHAAACLRAMSDLQRLLPRHRHQTQSGYMLTGALPGTSQEQSWLLRICRLAFYEHCMNTIPTAKDDSMCAWTDSPPARLSSTRVSTCPVARCCCQSC